MGRERHSPSLERVLLRSQTHERLFFARGERASFESCYISKGEEEGEMNTAPVRLTKTLIGKGGGKKIGDACSVRPNIFFGGVGMGQGRGGRHVRHIWEKSRRLRYFKLVVVGGKGCGQLVIYLFIFRFLPPSFHPFEDAPHAVWTNWRKINDYVSVLCTSILIFGHPASF